VSNLSKLLFTIEPLSSKYDRNTFDCGEPLLNNFLKQQASQLQKRLVSRTYLAIDQDNQIAGFYSLSTTQVHRTQSPDQFKQFSAYQPIPAALIGRLAIDQSHQGQGVGRYLLAHALTTIKRLADTIGIAVVVIDAKNKDVAEFYKKFGFFSSSDLDLQLFLLVKSIPDVG
jgi:GNAT superfamily N-acetyltransferase